MREADCTGMSDANKKRMLAAQSAASKHEFFVRIAGARSAERSGGQYHIARSPCPGRRPRLREADCTGMSRQGDSPDCEFFNRLSTFSPNYDRIDVSKL